MTPRNPHAVPGSTEPTYRRLKQHQYDIKTRFRHVDQRHKQFLAHQKKATDIQFRREYSKVSTDVLTTPLKSPRKPATPRTSKIGAPSTPRVVPRIPRSSQTPQSARVHMAGTPRVPGPPPRSHRSARRIRSASPYIEMDPKRDRHGTATPLSEERRKAMRLLKYADNLAERASGQKRDGAFSYRDVYGDLIEATHTEEQLETEAAKREIVRQPPAHVLKQSFSVFDLRLQTINDRGELVDVDERRLKAMLVSDFSDTEAKKRSAMHSARISRMSRASTMRSTRSFVDETTCIQRDLDLWKQSAADRINSAQSKLYRAIFLLATLHGFVERARLHMEKQSIIDGTSKRLTDQLHRRRMQELIWNGIPSFDRVPSRTSFKAQTTLTSGRQLMAELEAVQRILNEDETEVLPLKTSPRAKRRMRFSATPRISRSTTSLGTETPSAETTSRPRIPQLRLDKLVGVGTPRRNGLYTKTPKTPIMTPRTARSGMEIRYGIDVGSKLVSRPRTAR